jgi:preprotein translocase SecE subunit
VSVLSVALLVAALFAVAAIAVWREQVRGMARSTTVFVGEVQNEVKKVTWPDRQQLKSMTGVIILFVFAVMAIIGLMDVILQLIFTTWLPRWFG